jgi:hypothetical protein
MAAAPGNIPDYTIAQSFHDTDVPVGEALSNLVTFDKH